MAHSPTNGSLPELPLDACPPKATAPCSPAKDLHADQTAALLQPTCPEGMQFSDAGRGRRCAVIFLFAALLIVTGLAVARRSGAFRGLRFISRSSAFVSFSLIEPDQELSVTRKCWVAKRVGDSERIVHLHPGCTVIAAGPAEQFDGLYLLPIKGGWCPNEREADHLAGVTAGAIQTACLELPEDSRIKEITDCELDQHDWQRLWSEEKKNYCCGKISRFCRMHRTPGGDGNGGVTGGTSNGGAGAQHAGASTLNEGCTEVCLTEGYKFCRDTYCGQDVTTGPLNLSRSECQRRCDEDPNCVAYEVFGHDNNQCTLRSFCGSPVGSSIGTFVAFKENFVASSWHPTSSCS